MKKESSKYRAYRHAIALMAVVMLLGVSWRAEGQAVSDSVDITHTHIALDLGHSRALAAYGTATIDWHALRTIDTLRLLLYASAIDTVVLDGTLASYRYYSTVLSVYVDPAHATDTHRLVVAYRPSCHVENRGLGGFHMDPDLHYTIGVAFQEFPHSFGRSWFPCRDNFRDKCTFSLAVTPPDGWIAECGGMHDSTTTGTDSSRTFHFSLRQPSPAYLISATAAPYQKYTRDLRSTYGTYPLSVAYRNHSEADVAAAFSHLDLVVPHFENLLGPYRWGRIGYCATTIGSMEHINNISLTSACVANSMALCQHTISHELAHSWFGNLITCAEDGDMWWNEGGASFCEELSIEATDGIEAARQFAFEQLETVVRSAHIDDRGLRPLLYMDSLYTYGTTVYRKGAAFFHALRSHLGDSLFFGSLQRLFGNNAFGSMDWTAIRDSLSAYSGHDLRDYFDYHLGQPGFADYIVDSLTLSPDSGSLCLVMRQHSAGNSSYCRDNRVPVTFGTSSASQPRTTTVWFEFGDSIAHLSTPIDFVPDYAVCDLGHMLSTAAFADTLRLSKRGTTTLPLQHFRTTVRNAADSAIIAVTHHYSSPCFGNDMPANVVRPCNRFWQVDGALPAQGLRANGMFHYCRGTSRNTSAPYLDNGFYDRSASFDSLALLYRASLSEPWRLISRSTSGNTEEGYLVVNTLKKGYYTLAIIDTAASTEGITQAAASSEGVAPQLVPNPSRDGRLHLEADGSVNTAYSIEIFDNAGRHYKSLANATAGTTLRLPSGTYHCVITQAGHRWTQTVIVR